MAVWNLEVLSPRSSQPASAHVRSVAVRFGEAARAVLTGPTAEAMPPRQ
jgi:hypothetical protein